MKYQKLLIMLCMAMGLTATEAVARQCYTLDECREKALTNNVKIKNSRNGMEMAEQTKKEAFTGYFPNINAGGLGFIADKGLLELDMMGNRLSIADDGLAGGVSASMPLFTGGRIVNANKLASLAVEVEKLKNSQTEKEVMLTVETYYWNVVVLKAKLETLDAIDRMTSNLLKDVEASVSAGITTNNDLLQVKLKQNDIESKRITLEGQLQLSRMVLGQYIGEYADSIDVASGIDGGYVPDDPAYLHCDHRAALYDTEEYKLLGKNIDAVKLQYKQTVGKYMPTVAIGGGYMCDNIMDHSHPFWIGFTTVSIPLTDWWGGSHAMKKSKLEMRMAENNLDDGTDLLLIKMQKAWNNV